MNRRQHKWVIEREFQFRFTLKVCLVAAGIFLLFGSILLFLVKTNYEMLIQDALLQMPEMVSQLRREFRLMSLTMVASLILMVAVLFGLGLVLTQRLAGPIYALRRQLALLGEGKRGVRLLLRGEDEFLPLAHTFNDAMERWEQRQAHHSQLLEKSLNSLKKGDIPQAQQSLKQALEQFQP